MSSRNFWMPYGFFMLRSLRSSLGVKPGVRPEWLSVIGFWRFAFVLVQKCLGDSALRCRSKNGADLVWLIHEHVRRFVVQCVRGEAVGHANRPQPDRKSTRLNYSHLGIS